MVKIFSNARIYSLDNNFTIYEALASENGIILSLGKNEDIIKKYSNLKDIEIIDLKDNTVVPGFNDSHVHFISYGYNKENIQLYECKSVDDMINLCKDKKPYKGWIVGRGFNQDLFLDKRMPNKHDLDKISKDLPVYFIRCCGHLIVVNSKALEICGIKKDTVFQGGTIDYDNGIITENAISLVSSYMPSIEVKEIKDYILSAQESFLKMGVTSVQSDDLRTFSDEGFIKIIEAYEELKNEGRLKIRVYEQAQLPTKNLIDNFIKYYYSKYKNDNLFSIGPIKIIIDGSLGARTAFLSGDYKDNIGNRGVLQFTEEELNDIASYADNLGYSLAIHAIGDGAIDIVLNTFDYLHNSAKVSNNKRHGIVHCQITRDDIIEKMKRLNALAYIQPIFLDYDMHIVESRIGKEKSKRTYAYKTMFDNGIHISFGSDGPIDSISVIEAIHCAVNRQDKKMYPKEGWIKEEKLSVKEALYCYTLGSAYSSFSEDIKGSLEKGKLADFVVLDKDIFSIDKNDILNTQVLATIIDGNMVYRDF